MGRLNARPGILSRPRTALRARVGQNGGRAARPEEGCRPSATD